MAKIITAPPKRKTAGRKVILPELDEVVEIFTAQTLDTPEDQRWVELDYVGPAAKRWQAQTVAGNYRRALEDKFELKVVSRCYVDESNEDNDRVALSFARDEHDSFVVADGADDATASDGSPQDAPEPDA